MAGGGGVVRGGAGAEEDPIARSSRSMPFVRSTYCGGVPGARRALA